MLSPMKRKKMRNVGPRSVVEFLRREKEYTEGPGKGKGGK